MASIRKIHYLNYFKKSYKQKNKEFVQQVQKLKDLLGTPIGDSFGEQLKKELKPLRSYPRGRRNLRILYLLCSDCKKKALKKQCSFCETDIHSMNDAVFFYVGRHDKAYDNVTSFFKNLKK